MGNACVLRDAFILGGMQTAISDDQARRVRKYPLVVVEGGRKLPLLSSLIGEYREPGNDPTLGLVENNQTAEFNWRPTFVPWDDARVGLKQAHQFFSGRHFLFHEDAALCLVNDPRHEWDKTRQLTG